MNAPLTALHRLINAVNPEKGPGLLAELDQLILSDIPFAEKIKPFDQLFTHSITFEPVAEYAFDLMMAHHLEKMQAIDSYFESKEWMDIEDKTLERGTELLNLALYLTEAREQEVAVELDDFLNEFLLVDEDEFQDEFVIYESLIANAELAEAEPSEIITMARKIETGTELKDLWVPVLLFFNEPEQQITLPPGITPIETGLYLALHSLYH